MTPPNELEQLAEFQDAIQSNKGLERLRAMQYLQQMNNQGLMGMPQVQQQPVVQRGNGGKVFNNLDEATAANLPPNSKFFIVDDPDPYFIDDNGNIAKEMQEGITTGIDAYTEEDIKDGSISPEAAIEYNKYLRNLEESDRDRPQYNRRQSAEQYGDIGGIGGLQSNAGGGPVIHKFGSGTFKNFLKSENVQKMFAPTGAEPAREPVNYPIQNQGQAVPFMGGSGVAIPDPNISQAEAINNLQNMSGGFGGNSGLGSIAADMFETINSNRGSQRLANEVNYVEAPAEENIIAQTMESANADAMERGLPSFIFNNQEFETGTMIPIRANTQEGMRDRSVEGGLIDRGNRFSGSLMAPNPNFVTPEEGLNQIAMSSPGPMSPGKVEFTPPFYGGGMMPQPMMVSADAQGNPIMPISKQALGFGAPMLAEQGGYVQNLADGGLTQGRELQQLKEGGLVNLPVLNMGIGGALRRIFSAPVKLVKNIAKGAKKVVKSKTFKALAPLVLAVAAPYALGALAPGVFGASATALGGALSTSGALGYGLATGLGSMAGNLLGGARFGDAAKQGLMSGLTAGAFKGFGSGNWMGTGTGGNVASQAGNVKQINAPKTILQAGTAPDAVVAPTTGGNPFANQMAVKSAPIGENILTNVNAVPPNVGMSPNAYTGQGLQANQMIAPTTGIETVVPNQFSNVQFSPNVDVGVPPAPDATRTGFFNQGPLSNTGGSPAPGTGSTLDSIKQIGKDIVKDYGNFKGAAKLVGMDMMQPNWDEVYASEEAMENQLADMGYTVDTGFDGQKVYRDSSGTVMPSNLTAREILDRALGRTPRTRLADRIGFEPNATALAAKGGLVSLAGGGEFSGMVEGDGHGMQDNVYMPIVERGQGSQVGTLAVSPSEYVVDAHTMSALGNGNPDAGAKVMDNVIKSVRKKAFGTTEQPNQINGLNALMPMMQGV